MIEHDPALVEREKKWSIWKWAIPVTDCFTLKMPDDAQILCVQVQNEEPCIWASVVKDACKVNRTFYVVGTGNPFPKKADKYIGTFQLHGGRFVGHLYEGLPLDYKRPEEYE